MHYYPDHRLMAWQPQGTLDDIMLDQIAVWLVDIEQEYVPFKRFIDFSQLRAVAVRTVTFLNLRERERPIHRSRARANCVVCRRLGLPCIARLYESLMEATLIEARAFRDLARAAEWLGIPVDVLTLKDEPTPPDSNRA